MIGNGRPRCHTVVPVGQVRPDASRLGRTLHSRDCYRGARAMNGYERRQHPAPDVSHGAEGPRRVIGEGRST